MADKVIIEFTGDFDEIKGQLSQFENELRQKGKTKMDVIDEKQLGIIERLENKMRTLQENMKKAKTKEGVQAINKELKKTQKELSGLTTQGAKGLSVLKSQFASLIPVISAAFVVQRLSQFAQRLGQLQIEMDKTARKARTVFGASFEKVQAQARDMANEIGLTRNEFVGVATALQDILVPMGFVRDTAADMSLEITKLAGALAQWDTMGRSANEIGQAFASSLSGETEGLKSFGVIIQQGNKSFRESIETQMRVKGVTEQQAKALTILNEITRQTTDAQRAFAESGDSLAVSQAKVDAEIRQAEEDLAQATAGLQLYWLQAKKAAIDYFDATTIGTTLQIQLVKKQAEEFEASLRNRERVLAESSENGLKYVNALSMAYSRGQVSLQLYSDYINEGGKRLKTLATLSGEAQFQFNRLTNEYTSGSIALNDYLLKLRELITVDQQQAGGRELGYIEGLQKRIEQLNIDVQQASKAELPALVKQLEAVQAEMDKALGRETKTTQTPKEKEKELNLIYEAKKKLIDQTTQDEIFQATVTAQTAQELADAKYQIEMNYFKKLKKLRVEEGMATLDIDQQIADMELQRRQEDKDRLEKEEKEILAIKKKYAEESLAGRMSIIEAEMELEQAKANLRFAIADQMAAAIGHLAQNDILALILEKSVAIARMIIEYQKARLQLTALMGYYQASMNYPAAVNTGIQMGILKANFATSLAAVIGTAIPQFIGAAKSSGVAAFAEGTSYVHGAGSQTSDDIPAWLSRGERVVTAEKNQRYWNDLEAIHRGDYERYVNQNYVLPALREATANAMNLKDEKLAHAIASSMMGTDWKGENIAMELHKQRNNDIRHHKELVSAIVRTNKKSRRKF